MKYFTRYSLFLLPLTFLVIGLLTIYDYGMNWDSPVHFARGQAYLRYILTGKTNYNDNPTFCTNEYNLNSRVDAATGEVCDRHRYVRVSEYESSLLDFNSWVATGTYGHPAFSDIMLAASNGIFYKFLGLFEDLNAYHLYSVFTTFLLALTVSVWVKQTHGTFGSVVAVLSLYGFPLLFAESHFNVKDPPMATFFTIALYFFWLALVRKKALFLIFSALAGGASFATKLNFVFAPFVLLLWVALYSFSSKFGYLSKKMILAFILYPIIILLVFFLSWPALWIDPIAKFFKVIKYYQDIGGSSCQYFYFTPGWLTECTQLLSLQYFIFTTPPFILLLILVGLVVSIVKFRENKFVTLIWLSLFIFTLMRVTLSLTSIYGGLRQIMEFIPAMAMIAGAGAVFLRDLITKIIRASGVAKKPLVIGSFIILLGFVTVYWQIYRFHPYQNVYFNSLIGGFQGAVEQNFPGYGNTYGSVTLHGVHWLNKHAEPNAKLALVSGNAQNVSRATMREDIELSNGSRSGYNLEGEYLVLPVVGQDIFGSTFRHQYPNKFLNPVYDLQVDGVSILKIWKNDKKYLKKGVDPDELTKLNKARIKTEIDHKKIFIKLEEKAKLRALGITLPSDECKQQIVGARLELAENDEDFIPVPDSINGYTEREILGYGADYVYLFAGNEVQNLALFLPTTYQCKPADIKFSVFTFAK